jgi:hypothetical protein
MSSVILTGDTSGTLTLSAPLVAGSNTVTLPAATGTISLLTQGTAVASTSGTSIDFTGIPSWAKRITVMFSGVSTNGTSGILVQLGTSSGIVSSGYDAGTVQGTNSLTLTSTSGVPLRVASAANTYSGLATWVLMGSNLWTCNVIIGSTVVASMVFGGGNVNAGGIVDRVRVTNVNGTDTFDAGSINVMWEG